MKDRQDTFLCVWAILWPQYFYFSYFPSLDGPSSLLFCYEVLGSFNTTHQLSPSITEQRREGCPGQLDWCGAQSFHSLSLPLLQCSFWEEMKRWSAPIVGRESNRDRHCWHNYHLSVHFIIFLKKQGKVISSGISAPAFCDKYILLFISFRNISLHEVAF